MKTLKGTREEYKNAKDEERKEIAGKEMQAWIEYLENRKEALPEDF